MRIKEIADQIKSLTDQDFQEVEESIRQQDLHPETKKKANANRRVITLFTHLYWQIKQEKKGLMPFAYKRS